MIDEVYYPPEQIHFLFPELIMTIQPQFSTILLKFFWHFVDGHSYLNDWSVDWLNSACSFWSPWFFLFLFCSFFPLLWSFQSLFLNFPDIFTSSRREELRLCLILFLDGLEYGIKAIDVGGQWSWFRAPFLTWKITSGMLSDGMIFFFLCVWYFWI